MRTMLENYWSLDYDSQCMIYTERLFCNVSRNLNHYLLWFEWYYRLISKYPTASFVGDQLLIEAC